MIYTADGKLVKETFENNGIPDVKKEVTNCYGAKKVDDCKTCEDVKKAFDAEFKVYNVTQFEQCPEWEGNISNYEIFNGIEYTPIKEDKQLQKKLENLHINACANACNNDKKCQYFVSKLNTDCTLHYIDPEKTKKKKNVLMTTAIRPLKSCGAARHQYFKDYPDVQKEKIDAWDHYVQKGEKEGKVWKGKPCTNSCGKASREYLSKNNDVFNKKIDAWTHYSSEGVNEEREWNGEICTKSCQQASEDFVRKYPHLSSFDPWTFYRVNGFGMREGMEWNGLPCETKYYSIGCWKDTWDRAIPVVEDAFEDAYKYKERKDAVNKCYDYAKSKGYKAFAVQDGGHCQSGPNAHITYDRFGGAITCGLDGRGGVWGNEVYMINQ